MLSGFASNAAQLHIWAFQLWARAGGGGGGHGGGGHSGGFSGGGHSYGGGGYSGSGSGGLGLFELVFYLLARPWGWVVLAVVVYVIYQTQLNSGGSGGGGPTVPLPIPEETIPLPAEEVTLLQQKTKTAFITIQGAWSQKTTTPMRRYISDGVYQRFNAQFSMMNQLDQINPISGLDVISIRPLHYEADGAYESVDLEIRATADDQFISKKYPQFNTPGGAEEFVECWTFMRRRGHTSKADIFHQDVCPKCAGPLDDKLLESARCPYCGVYINSGEFDWVLCEITQPDFYQLASRREGAAPDLAQKIQFLTSKDPRFSRQMIEDRASNAYLQVLIGLANRSMQSVQRFCTPDYALKVKASTPTQHIVYDRLFLDSSDVLKLEFLPDNLVRATVGISYSSQRVQLAAGQAEMLDADVITHRCNVILVHQMSAQIPKGSIYANACPTCGAAQKDSLNANCEYCGAVLNDIKGDWIVEDVVVVA